MVAISREEEKQTFAKRLAAACNFRHVKERGRAAYLAKQMGVSTQAAQKWLDAESIPDQTNIGRLAKILKVNAEWLQVGPGDQVLPANTDEMAQKLALVWPELSDTNKQILLQLARGMTLPDNNNAPKSTLEPPPLGEPIGK